MKIVEISTNGNGKVRLKALMNMSTGQQGVAELEEFKSYGSDAEKSYGLDIAMNRVFKLGNISLIARGRGDKVVIKKLDAFDLSQYNKAFPSIVCHVGAVKNFGVEQILCVLCALCGEKTLYLKAHKERKVTLSEI